MTTTPKRHVLVLGGGPDAEREVSLESSRCVAEALAKSDRFSAERVVIGAISGAELRKLRGDIIFPVLHGPFGEGGPMQDLLVADGRPYVGCAPGAARRAMCKISTKLAAASNGVPTREGAVLNPGDATCPLDFPVVLKPVHEGSSVGVHIVREAGAWGPALEQVRADLVAHPGRVYMVEGAVLGGSELTVGVLDGGALAPIRIRPAVEFYDYEAKYNRDDTGYDVDPSLPPGVREAAQSHAITMARALGVRHLCRVDFLMDAQSRLWLLEVNTLPGFTTHSLLPKAAAHAGMTFTALAERLVDFACRDHALGR